MSTANYRIDFDEIKRAVSMEAVMTFLSLSGLKQRGPRQWKGICPFCKGVECFVVTADGGREKLGAFNCFKCPAGGDQIELVSMMRGNVRKDPKGSFAAAKELHERFLAKGGNGGGEARDRSDASPQPQRERKSGFDPEAYAKGLDPAHEALAPLGLAAGTLREWKAGYASTGINRGRLALPITVADGTIIGFVGRTLKDETPTLTAPNGLVLAEHIFGVDHVGEGQLILVRDPLAVLRAAEAGHANVVSFLTEEVTPAQVEVLAKLMTERRCDSLLFF
jgi:hypothetical protein